MVFGSGLDRILFNVIRLQIGNPLAEEIPAKGKPLKDDVTDEEILNDLEDGFLAFDEVKLMSYVDPSTSTLSKTALDTAVTFTTEYKLAEQIWKANVSDGAVTRPPTLVREYNR